MWVPARSRCERLFILLVEAISDDMRTALYTLCVCCDCAVNLPVPPQRAPASAPQRNAARPEFNVSPNCQPRHKSTYCRFVPPRAPPAAQGWRPFRGQNLNSRDCHTTIGPLVHEQWTLHYRTSCLSFGAVPTANTNHKDCQDNSHNNNGRNFHDKDIHD